MSDSKRVLIASHFQVSKGRTQVYEKPGVDATPAGRARSFPQLPDDIQAQLVNVGMRARKSVSDGYKQQGSLPSYRGHAIGPLSGPIFESYEGDTDDESDEPASRANLKRGREDDDEDASKEPRTLTASKVYYVPRKAQVSFSSGNDEFEDAPFLMDKDKL
uniref:Damage-regulated import facilitator 1 n=1 Tax=Blastobotrys adeninivorans TaxID=409370 RepID=A0A060TFT3_BLAAD